MYLSFASLCPLYKVKERSIQSINRGYIRVYTINNSTLQKSNADHMVGILAEHLTIRNNVGLRDMLV